MKIPTELQRVAGAGVALALVDEHRGQPQVAHQAFAPAALPALFDHRTATVRAFQLGGLELVRLLEAPPSVVLVPEAVPAHPLMGQWEVVEGDLVLDAREGPAAAWIDTPTPKILYLSGATARLFDVVASEADPAVAEGLSVPSWEALCGEDPVPDWLRAHLQVPVEGELERVALLGSLARLWRPAPGAALAYIRGAEGPPQRVRRWAATLSEAHQERLAEAAVVWAHQLEEELEEAPRPEAEWSAYAAHVALVRDSLESTLWVLSGAPRARLANVLGRLDAGARGRWSALPPVGVLSGARYLQEVGGTQLNAWWPLWAG